MSNAEDTEPVSDCGIEVLHLVRGKYAFQKGEQFSSFDQVLQRMTLHTNESMVFYWHRDSRTVKNAHTKTSRPISAQLKYYSLRFACIYSSMKRELRDARQRAVKGNHKRTGCQAFILLRASKCGQYLEVASVCNVHNHEISREVTKKLPQTRKLSEELKEEVIEMLKLKIDRKKIIEYVQVRENKSITSKKLFNLSARLRSTELASREPEEREAIYHRIMQCSQDKGVLSTISNELANFDLNETSTSYYPTDNDELIEYISPDHEFGVNETIIESIVESRQHETRISNSFSPFDYPPVSYSSIMHEEHLTDDLSVPLGMSEEKKEEDDSMDFHSQFVEQGTQPFHMKSEIAATEECETSIIEYDHDDNEQIHEATESQDDPASLPASNFGVILYETTTDVSVRNEISVEAQKLHHQSTEKINHPNKCSRLKRIVNRTGGRISRCRLCSTDFRIVRAQVDYLKAKRNKLLEETKLLRLERKKLLREINDDR